MENSNIRLYSKTDMTNRDKSLIAQIIKWLGILTYVGGFVWGSFVAEVNLGYLGRTFNWTIAIIIWFAAFYSGTLLLGFASIINMINSLLYNGYYGNITKSES